MQRYNSFQLIHKGLRAALYDTAWKLQQADFTNEDEAEEAINKVKEVVLLFDGHAHKEDQYILPMIAAYEPSVVASFEQEHVEDIRLGEGLNQRLDAYGAATSDNDRVVAGRYINDAFVEFMMFNLRHMAKEEDILNKLLWRYYTDDEIRETAGRIAANTPPWMQDFYAKWILRGINNPEAVTWIHAIQKGMPKVVFQSLVTKAEQELPTHRFQKVVASLSEGAQLAS